jgi:hypothetical protein
MPDEDTQWDTRSLLGKSELTGRLKAFSRRHAASVLLLRPFT